MRFTKRHRTQLINRCSGNEDSEAACDAALAAYDKLVKEVASLRTEHKEMCRLQAMYRDEVDALGGDWTRVENKWVATCPR